MIFFPQLVRIGYAPEGSDAHINSVVADLGKKGRRGAGVIAEHIFDDNFDAMQAMGTVELIYAMKGADKEGD